MGMMPSRICWGKTMLMSQSDVLEAKVEPKL